VLARTEPDLEDESAVYALLTKWTQGESSGGGRQNFFRVLADAPETTALVEGAEASAGTQSRVMVKSFEPGDGLLRFVVAAVLPRTDDVQEMLPPLLAAADRVTGEEQAGRWCVVCEGSPRDWAEGLSPTSRCDELINSRGPILDGDILVLCPREGLPALAQLYRRQYERRVADFVALYRREAALPGSVSIASLYQVMDSLNVDIWRIEQLLGIGVATSRGDRTLGQDAAPRSLLQVFRALPGLHPLFFCDNCGSRELRGYRYNCLVCSDFDLCAACHEAGSPAPEAAPPTDHIGRCHERWHRMLEVRPALPPQCLL